MQRDELQRVNPGWRFVEDSGRGYRRVVASPQPKRIVEAEAIKTLTQQGFVVIGAGGGGIPVVRSDQGDYQSVDAVIDKDLHGATGAGDPRRHFGDHHRRRASLYSFWQTQPAGAGYGGCRNDDPLHAGGTFPPGSMLPKIVASPAFLERGGKRVIITTPECLPAALRGETGTHIVHS